MTAYEDRLIAIRCVFIDRDGTINVEKGYVHRPEDFEYIPGVLAALRRLTDAGVRIFIVTNQAGIAKGLFTEADFAELTKLMLEQMSDCGVRIADVLYCPHHPEGTVVAYRKDCECRKPGVGLIRDVMEEEGFQADEVALIGDKNSDIEAGRRLGMRTYLVQTGYGIVERHLTPADFLVADVQAAVDHLLSHPSIRRICSFDCAVDGKEPAE